MRGLKWHLLHLSCHTRSFLTDPSFGADSNFPPKSMRWIKKYTYMQTISNIFSHKNNQKTQNRKIDNFMFLTISLVFFQIKRCSKCHFNPLNNSFLPLEEKFTPGLIFFELLKAPKNTLLWLFQVNFNEIWTSIWTL